MQTSDLRQHYRCVALRRVVAICYYFLEQHIFVWSSLHGMQLWTATIGEFASIKTDVRTAWPRTKCWHSIVYCFILIYITQSFHTSGLWLLYYFLHLIHQKILGSYENNYLMSVIKECIQYFLLVIDWYSLKQHI